MKIILLIQAGLQAWLQSYRLTVIEEPCIVTGILDLIRLEKVRGCYGVTICTGHCDILQKPEKDISAPGV